MAPKDKQKIENEKTHRDPLLSFNQAVTVDCSAFLGTALSTKKKSEERQRQTTYYSSRKTFHDTLSAYAHFCIKAQRQNYPRSPGTKSSRLTSAGTTGEKRGS